MTTDPFARLGAFVYRRRRWVLGFWLVALLVCAPLAGKANGVLKAGGVEVPGSDSQRASAVLSKQFDVSALNNAAIVFHSDSMKVGDAQFKAQVQDAADRVKKAKGVTNVVTYYKTLLPTLVSKDRHTTVVFASMEGDEGTTQDVRRGRPQGRRGHDARALRHRPGGRQPRLLGHERPRPPPRRGDHLHARPDPAPGHVPHGRLGVPAAAPRRRGGRERHRADLPDRQRRRTRRSSRSTSRR